MGKTIGVLVLLLATGAAAAPEPIVLRDLADGRPLPGFAVRIRCAGGAERTVVSATDGSIEVPERARSVAAVAGGWTVPDDPAKALREGGSVWLLRRVTVRGRVTIPEDAGDLTMAGVEVGSCVLGDLKAPGVPGHGGPWTHGWASGDHDFSDPQELTKPRPDGTFELSLPAVRGLTVYTKATGWMPVRKRIRLPAEPDGTVDVWLPLDRRAIRLHGTLVGRDGEPMRDLVVKAYVTKRMSAREYRTSLFRSPHYGYTSRVSNEKDRAIVNHEASGRTGPDGGFDLWVHDEGEILVVVFPPGGYAPIYHAIRRKAGDQSRVRLPVTWVGEEGRVRLHERGVPAAAEKARFMDFSLDGPQVTFSIPIGPNGEIPTALLVPGHRYRIGMRGWGSGPRYLVWQPTDSLDLLDLPRRPPWSGK